MEEKDILKLVQRLKECVRHAFSLTGNHEDILKFTHDPEFVLQQKEDVRSIALEIFAIYQVFKNRKIIRFSASGAPFFVEETETHFVMHTQYNGADLRYLIDKETGESHVDDSDVMNKLGINEEFLNSDEGLDLINEIKTNHPEIPLFGDDGLFRNVTNRTKFN